jgi:plastocyanin
MRLAPVRLVAGSVLAGALIVGGLASHVQAAHPVAAKNTCVPAPTDGKGGPYPAKKSSDCTAMKTVTVYAMADPKTFGAFVPSNITIKKGTTVIWIWKTGPHNVSFINPSVKLIDSGFLNPGGKFKETFTKTGVFKYQCQVHPMQFGLITVK